MDLRSIRALRRDSLTTASKWSKVHNKSSYVGIGAENELSLSSILRCARITLAHQTERGSRKVSLLLPTVLIVEKALDPRIIYLGYHRRLRKSIESITRFRQIEVVLSATHTFDEFAVLRVCLKAFSSASMRLTRSHITNSNLGAGNRATKDAIHLGGSDKNRNQ